MADFFSGLAAGLQNGQSIKARRSSEAMQQQQLDMQNKELDMKTQKFNQDMKLQQMQMDEAKRNAAMKDGLNQAFSSGGYEGAMDYLKHEDMQTYMAISKGKAEVDKSIADANSSKYASEKDRQETVKNGWMILGRFGAALQKVPENERPQAYQQMLPVLQSIYPDAPKAYDERTQQLMTVAMGVSMPDSQLYGAQKQLARSQTTIGKLDGDIRKLQAEGVADNDPSLQALRNQLKAEIDNSTDAQLTAAKNAKGEDELRNQYLQLNKDFITTRDAFNNIRNYSSNPKVVSTAGDMKLIYAYNKMLDPNSTVREGEYATVKNAGSWDDRSRAQYNAALKGTLLSDKVRDDYLKNAAGIYDAKKQGYEVNQKNYTALAVNRGLDPKNIVLDLTTDGGIQSSNTPDQNWAQQVKALNPGYSDADVAAAWEYTQKQKAGQSVQQSAPQQGAPQQSPVGEGNPPWQANRSM